jgi:putative PIG3 family NAD(P)H quinone oxidoreductase
MRAVVAPEPGGPEALQVVDLPVPEPGPGEVLIGIRAAGVNRADILQRQGFYPPPPGVTDVLGLECSGTIAAIGPDVHAFAVGDEVCALLAGGGYADFVVAPAGQVAPLPVGLDLIAGAGLMETACTVWSNLVMVAGLKAGETLLVHGGSSGIGTTAIQVAKLLGARVVTTVGTSEKAAAVAELGADFIINYRDEDFADAMKGAHVAADVILDIIGAKYLASNISALAPEGRIVIIGLQGGIQAELNLAALLAKRGSITATSIRARPIPDKEAIVRATAAGLFGFVTDGTLRPIIDRTFPLEDVAAAHKHLESSSHIGKIVLEL